MRAPSFLADFQRDFSRLLLVPLEIDGGNWRSNHERYPEALVERIEPKPPLSASARLGIYHRQYWFRLLDLLHKSYPLTARLLGFFDFNRPGIEFFLENPPSSREIDSVVDGFPEFFAKWARENRPLDAAYWIEGVTLDDAFRSVFGAPRVEPFVPTREHASLFEELRLARNPATRIHWESFGFLAVRSKVIADAGEAPWPRIPGLASRTPYLLARKNRGVAHVGLESSEARLYELLAEGTVRDALAKWEQEHVTMAASEREAKVALFLQRSVKLGLFSGLRDDD